MKQHEYREPNRNCFECATPRPNQIKCREEFDLTDFRCAKCGETILWRITTTTDTAQDPHIWIPPQLIERTAAVPTDRVGELGLYWTRKEWSVTINGRHVYGDPRITELGEHLESL